MNAARRRGNICFDMESLSKLDGAEATSALRPLADASTGGSVAARSRIGTLNAEEADVARAAVETARSIAVRLRVGIDLLPQQTQLRQNVSFSARPHHVAAAFAHACTMQAP